MLKRLFDFVAALAGLIVVLPFMAIVALLIRLTSAGPAVFRQTRCGLNGRRFVLYKLRSMCHGAEKLRPALEHLSSRETAIKIPNDPRLTPIDRFLRKFSIDEWPQFWNVLRGDLSMAGRDEVDFETWMKMDMEYIDNWSPALDWKIIFSTLPRVLTGIGAN